VSAHAARERHSPVVRDDDDTTKAAILVAAVRVMARHGYHGTSVRDIAVEAGVSAGSLYHHFGSKHDLLFTILDRGVDLLVRRTEDALFESGDDPADRLRAIVRTHVLTHTESRRESFIGNSELRGLGAPARAVVVAKRDAQQRMFDRVVADGVRRGVFTTADPVEASRFIVTACTAVAAWYHPSGALSAQEIADHYARVALDTVGYRRP
jgi:AcrR family transcriptional regulator